ncbi:cGMP-dependent protein kinase 1 isoform X7 [Thunnus thynnus]|uniref:cGMP-dependent protein kinase 1 isoform X7 n=1 Tax=Thunnus thynnus TaxID=8237 RepID=UPI0035282A7F
MINVHHSTYYSQASEIPQRPSDPIGIQSMHFSLQPPLSWSCDCLLSVPSPGQPRAREEHPLLHLGGYKGDLHLACRQTGTNLLRTNEKDAAYISIFCVTDTTWCLEVMGTLRDLQFALQLKIEELRQRDTLIDELELELDTKDELIRRLQEELDRYRATVSLTGPSAVGGACSAQGEDNQRAKRETVISEPFTLDPVTLAMVFHRSCDKSQESRKLIQAAFLKNDLLKNLDEGEIRAIIACMYSTTIHQGCYVIQEGTNGAQAYVVEEGRLEMTKDGLKVLTVEPEDMFGEVALLYNCTYTYSVAAQTDSKLWVIDRKSYQTILTQSGLNSLSYSMELLSSVPCLQSLPEDVIMKMSDLLEETHYTEGDYIIRQGAMGDTFYIISKGQVKVTEKKPGHEELSKLSERQWFGEKALWGLHKTFRDAECLYMLTEACLCGDLCSLLGDKGCLDECSTRFYTACVVEALSFLHYRGVVYRDVKPENVVLDEHGYAKLIGFRCAKKIEVGKKTWTFCGTPGYMAPEIILNKGHNISADLWSLGVFVFELLSGELPFSGFDPMKILTATIRGIDQIDFPKTISKSASSLIKKLCRSNPSERLGSQRNGAKNIQKHKWFEGFNWEGLCKGTLSPPLILKVKHLLDSSTYSHYTGDSAEPCTDWDDF